MNSYVTKLSNKDILEGEIEQLQGKDIAFSLIMGTPDQIADQGKRDAFAQVLGGDRIYLSTAGQMSSSTVADDEILAVSLEFEKSSHRVLNIDPERYQNHSEIGSFICNELAAPDLAGILLFATAFTVDATGLIQGVESCNSASVPIFGGLTADGFRREKCFLGHGDDLSDSKVIAIGLYGDGLKLTTTSRTCLLETKNMGVVTASDGDVLKSVNGIPALEFYKDSIPEQLNDLNFESWKYPLKMYCERFNMTMVRSILGIDEKNGSLKVACNIPANTRIEVLEGSLDDLWPTAKAAVRVSKRKLDKTRADLVLMLSGTGRRAILGENAPEAAANFLSEVVISGAKPVGFFSYGEFCTSSLINRCVLHNRSASILCLAEELVPKNLSDTRSRAREVETV